MTTPMDRRYRMSAREWLDAQPWDLFVTVTFRRRVDAIDAESAFLGGARTLARATATHIRTAFAAEQHLAGGHHVHAVIAGCTAERLDRGAVKQAWGAYGFVDVRFYERSITAGRGAAWYMTKSSPLASFTACPRCRICRRDRCRYDGDRLVRIAE